MTTHFNPLVTNGLSNHYHLDESTSIHRDIRSNFLFLFHFSSANRIAPDVTPPKAPKAASHLGLFCLPMSHKKGARLLWVKRTSHILILKRTHFHPSNAFLKGQVGMPPGKVFITC